MIRPLGDVAPEEMEFKLRGDRLCLNFAATVGERWGRGFERLRTPADLSRWFVQANVPGGPIKVGRELLHEARAFREAIYRSVKAEIAGKRPAPKDLRLINRVARGQGFAPQLDASTRRLLWVSEHPDLAALSEVARDAVLLLGSPDILRVKECAAPDCSLLFLDTSPPRRRRWCSMDVCGNRSKTAAYRRRRAAGDSNRS